MSLIDKFDKRIYKKSDNIVARKIVDEKILVPIQGNLADMQRIFSLTPVAEYIWERMDGSVSVKDIIDDVVGSFQVDEATATKDMVELLEQLLEFKLIREAQ